MKCPCCNQAYSGALVVVGSSVVFDGKVYETSQRVARFLELLLKRKGRMTMSDAEGIALIRGGNGDSYNAVRQSATKARSFLLNNKLPFTMPYRRDGIYELKRVR